MSKSKETAEERKARQERDYKEWAIMKIEEFQKEIEFLKSRIEHLKESIEED